MATPWYDYPVYSDYPATSYRNTDVGTPLDTPITASLPGFITFVGYEAWGGQVTWKVDDPSKVQGYPFAFVIHLDAINPNLRVGMHINAGDFLGYSGGETSTNGLPPMSAGFSHHPTDPSHSTGPHLDIGVTTSPSGSLDSSQSASNLLVSLAKAAGIPFGVTAGGPQSLSTSQAPAAQTCTQGLPGQCPDGYQCYPIGPSGLPLCNTFLSPAWAPSRCFPNSYFASGSFPCDDGSGKQSTESASSAFPSWLQNPNWSAVLKIGGGILLLGIGLLALFWPQAEQVISTVAKTAAVAA